MAQSEKEQDAYDLEKRKNQFKATFKQQKLTLKFGVLMICTIICGYFLQLELYHSYFESQIEYMYSTIPLFFNRFRYQTLSYSLMRERILMNGSLSSFESDPVYGQYIDFKYLDLSI